MMRTRALLPGVALGLLTLASGPPAPAQSLIGLDNGALAATGSLLHQLLPNCTHLGQCSTQGLFGPSIPNPFGGVAYNWIDGTVWATDGLVLVQMDPACNILTRCPIPATAMSRWTGLAIDPVQNMLYYTTPTNTIFKVPAACPLARSSVVCSLGPAILNLTGIEVDPWDGTLWACDNMGTVYHIAGGGPSGTCRIITSFRGRCPNSTMHLPVQGITIDRCRGEIYLSDDRFGLATLDMAGNPLHCCRLPSPGAGAHFVGLARRPERPRYRGQGCSAPSCPNCSPTLRATSDSNIPNPSFALEVDHGPVGGAAFFLFSGGGGTLSIPLLCGPLYVDLLPPPLSIGPLGLIATGGGACGGTATLAVPIPQDPTLCGGRVYCQVFGLCITAVNVGHFMTNGAVITLS